MSKVDHIYQKATCRMNKETGAKIWRAKGEAEWSRVPVPKSKRGDYMATFRVEEENDLPNP